MTKRSFVLLAAGTLGLVALLVRPETAAAAPKAAPSRLGTAATRRQVLSKVWIAAVDAGP